MKNSSKVSSFTQLMFIRQYIPALCSAVVFAVADMADALVVGNKMGTLGLAAIALSIPVYMLFNVIMRSLGLGGSIDFSKKMSRGREKEALESFQGILVTLLLIGVAVAIFGNLFLKGVLTVLGASDDNPYLITAAGTYLRIILAAAPLFFFDYSMEYYLRNDDMEKEASICSGIGNIADFSLNIILVLVFNMGVLGAALATFSGVFLSSLSQIITVLIRKKHLKFFPLSPDFKVINACFKTGASSCVSYVYSFVVIWLGNNAMLRLVGETGIAVFDVVQNMSSLMLYLFGSLANASQPIISTYEGECNYKEEDSLQQNLCFLVVITTLILMLVICLLPSRILMLFGINDSSAVAYGCYALRIFSLCILFAGLNIIISNYYSSRGIVFPAFFLSTLRGIAVLLPIMFICIYFGQDAFWSTYPVTEAVSLIFVVLYLKFFYKSNKRVDPERVYSTILSADSSDIAKAVADTETFCEKWEATPKQMYYVQMTIEEMCSAIITNGFTEKSRKNGKIQLTLVSMENQEFSLHIRDNAFSFNPFDMSKKDISDLEDEDKDFNALGMDIIKKKAKSFYYRQYQGFNTMVVKI